MKIRVFAYHTLGTLNRSWLDKVKRLRQLNDTSLRIGSNNCLSICLKDWPYVAEIPSTMQVKYTVHRKYLSRLGHGIAHMRYICWAMAMKAA